MNYVDKKKGEGVAKCQRYYISLCSKLVNIVYEYTLKMGSLKEGFVHFGIIKSDLVDHNNDHRRIFARYFDQS